MEILLTHICVTRPQWINEIAGYACARNPLRISEPDMHYGTCVTHVPWCRPGSLTGGFVRSLWRGKCSWHSRRTRNSPFYESGKKPAQMRSSSFCVRFKVYHIVGETLLKLIFHILCGFFGSKIYLIIFSVAMLSKTNLSVVSCCKWEMSHICSWQGNENKTPSHWSELCLVPLQIIPVTPVNKCDVSGPGASSGITRSSSQLIAHKEPSDILPSSNIHYSSNA